MAVKHAISGRSVARERCEGRASAFRYDVTQMKTALKLRMGLK